jgi:hypothetical protein
MENSPPPLNVPLNPAATVLRKCGGARVVADWRGLTLAAVHKWTYPRERGGTGGTIPADQQLGILLEARRAGVDLRPEDFFDLPAGLPPVGHGLPANDNLPETANDNLPAQLAPKAEA